MSLPLGIIIYPRQYVSTQILVTATLRNIFGDDFLVV